MAAHDEAQGIEVTCCICRQKGLWHPGDMVWCWSQFYDTMVAHVVCVEDRYYGVEGDF